VRLLLRAVRRHRHPLRDRVILLLSLKAGLRAGEIAALTWRMLEGPDGRIGFVIELPASAAKGGSGRRVPMNTELRRALIVHRKQNPGTSHVITSERGHAMTAKSVVNWFTRLCQSLQLAGCSSHSGRRTFITRAARLVHKAGGSLRDVQELAGHRSLKTTERYIAGDRDAQRRLVRML
jgi:integrase/recombinase XerD